MRNFIMYLIVVFMSACTSVPTLPELSYKYFPLSKASTPVPDWVEHGSGAYTEDNDQRVFYGVGSTTGIRNYSFMRQVANDRARASLAKVFKFYVGALTKDYQGHVTAQDFSKVRESQNVDGAMKIVTSATLSGVMIVDHWEFPERGEYYSLAKLDLNRFAENLSRYENLSDEVVNSVRERAKQLHEEMSKEIEKLSNRQSPVKKDKRHSKVRVLNRMPDQSDGSFEDDEFSSFVHEEDFVENDISEVHPEDEDIF